MLASFESLKDGLPDFAKDTKINLSNVLTPDGSPGLQESQMAGVALASAYATKNADVVKAVTEGTADRLTEQHVNAAKSAASVMAMNNVYYRFLHLVNDAEFKALPARLRMTVIGNPGVEKTDFELYSLAVSAINGCGMCIEAHANQLSKAGVSKEGIQSAVRIAAVINAFSQSVFIAQTT